MMGVPMTVGDEEEQAILTTTLLADLQREVRELRDKTNYLEQEVIGANALNIELQEQQQRVILLDGLKDQAVKILEEEAKKKNDVFTKKLLKLEEADTKLHDDLSQLLEQQALLKNDDLGDTNINPSQNTSSMDRSLPMSMFQGNIPTRSRHDGLPADTFTLMI